MTPGGRHATRSISSATPDEAAAAGCRRFGPCEFYLIGLDLLTRSGIPFLVGGAFAFQHYTGILRDTRDFDVFVRRDDACRVLELFAAAGYRTEMTFSHWLGKIHSGEHYVDVIFSSGNAVADVDEEWFEHAVEAVVLGHSVRLCPAEEMIWQKALILERERCDSADVAHLIRRRAQAIDWPRLLRRFGPHWRVLLAHLVLFGFIYPSERSAIPVETMNELLRRLAQETEAEPHSRDEPRVCRGLLLSRAQYLVDVECWGYRDPRLPPEGRMSRDQIAVWTAAIPRDK